MPAERGERELQHRERSHTLSERAEAPTVPVPAECGTTWLWDGARPAT